MTGYACRVHLEEPVSWKGTGCRQCDDPSASTTAIRSDDDVSLPSCFFPHHPRKPRQRLRNG